jgi:hypothetical protein
MSGLTTLADTAPSNDGTYFFVRNTDPVIVDNLVATTVITDELNLNGQAITADETAIFLNGVPYGGGGGGAVQTVTGAAPITVTGTVTDPVVGIDLSNIVTRSGAQTITGAKKFGILPQSITGVLPTDPDEFTNKLYVDNTIETWSQFPATQDVNMNLFKIANCAEIANNTSGFGLTITSDEDINIEAATGVIDITAQELNLHQSLNVNGYNLTGVGDIIGTTSNMLITTTTDITLKADEGVVEIDAKNLVITSNAPAGQLISDSTLQISTDNDMTITATDSLSITAGVMTINNALSMATHKITNVVDPTDPQDVATKAYVDSRPGGADTLANVLLAGNSAGATNIDMNGQDITGVNDIVMTGIVPTISAPLSATLTVAGLGATSLAAGTHVNITAPDYVSIGSAGYTTIENLHIVNSVITKETGTNDLQIGNVAAITNSAADIVIGNNQVQVKVSGDVIVNSQNQPLTLQSGTGALNINGGTTTDIGGGQLTLSATETIILDNGQSTTAPISLQTGLTENVCIQPGLPSAPLADSSILNVTSASKGIYIPRMPTTAREAITNPQNGLMVYDTTDADLYIYGPRGWAKTTLTNSANELLESLSGLDTGTRTRDLTGFNQVDAAVMKTNELDPIDPLVQPYIGIGGDVSMPGNSNLSFGLVGGGDGTIDVPNGNLNISATNIIVDAPIDITGDVSIGTLKVGSIAKLGTNTQIDVENNINLKDAIGLNGDYGTAGYVLVSNGSALPASWLPFVGAPVGGRLTLGAISGDTLVPATDLIWDTNTGVLV